MIPPKEHIVGAQFKWVRKNGVPNLIEVDKKGYIVPFKENLKILLTNDEIRLAILNPEQNNDEIYKSVLDGSYCKDHINENEIIRVWIEFYYDELVITNELSSVAKKHKLGMFYWKICNIDPKYMSNLNMISLYRYSFILKILYI